MREGRVAAITPPALLALWGGGVSLWYGRVGFHPLDHSIVFDGAWRLLCGQLPFRDFDTPFALTPMVMQVPFFALLGVTWFAACLHAALVNGAFAALVYGVLRVAGSRLAPSCTYAALAALTLYPPAGAPCHDQHAYFFSFLAVAGALLAARAATPRAAGILAALGAVALVLAYFSKQNPTVFAAPLYLLALLMAPQRRRLVAGAALALLTSLALLLALALLLRLDVRRFHEDYHRRPVREAARRTAGDEKPVHLLSALAALARRLGLATLPLAPATALGILLLSRQARRNPGHRVTLAVAGALPLVGLVAAHITFNDPEESLALLFPSLGLVDGVLAALAPVPGSTLTAARALLLLLALRDGAAFHARVNVTRAAIGRELGGEAGAELLPPSLSFLSWRIPQEYRFTAGDFAHVLAFLKDQPGSFWLMGDASVLYGLSGKPSVGSCMTFFPGLNMPLPGHRSPEFLAFEEGIVADFPGKGVRYIVMEGKGNWFAVRLKDFRRISGALAAEPGREWHFGAYTVRELPAGLRAGVLPPRIRHRARAAGSAVALLPAAPAAGVDAGGQGLSSRSALP